MQIILAKELQMGVSMTLCRQAVCYAALITSLCQPLHAAQDTNIWETRVFIEHTRCPVAGVPPPEPKDGLGAVAGGSILIALATQLIPKVFDFGMNYVSAELTARRSAEEAAKNGKSRTGYTTLAGFYLAGRRDDEKPWEIFNNTAQKCLVIIRGDFESADLRKSSCQNKSATPSMSAFSHPDFQEKATCEWLHSKGLKYDPGFYMELRFVPSPDQKYFKLATNYFYNRVPINEADPRSKSQAPLADASYDLEVAVELGYGVTTGKTGSGNLLFHWISRDTLFTGPNLAEKSTGWMRLPPMGLPEDITAKETLLDAVAQQNDAEADLKRLTAVIESGEAAAVRASAIADGLPSPPKGSPKERLAAVVAYASEELAKPEFDATLTAAALDADPRTSDDLNEKLPEKKLATYERAKRLREIEEKKGKLTALKTKAQDALTKLEEIATARKELKATKAKIEQWYARVSEHGHGGLIWAKDQPVLIDQALLSAPLDVKVTLTEKSMTQKDQFLASAADFFLTNQAALATSLSTAVTSALPKSKEDQINDAVAKSQFVISCISSKQTVDELVSSFNKLEDKNSTEAARLSLEIKKDKISANISCLQGGQDPPYRDVYAGDL